MFFCFLFFLLLLVGFDFSKAANRTVKVLKDASDVFNVVGNLVVEKDATIKGNVRIGTTTSSANLEVDGSLIVGKDATIKGNLDVNGTMNIKQSDCGWISIPCGGNGCVGWQEQKCPLGKYMAGYKNYRDNDWTRTGHAAIYCCKP